jgi:sterol 14-demethylase
MIHPALRDEKMQNYARFIEAEVDAFLRDWGDSGTVDLLAVMNDITIRTAGRCLIGAEFQSDLGTEFAELYHDLEGGINLVAFFAPDFPLPAMRRRDSARRKVVALLSDLIISRRASNISTDDFLDALIKARDADGAPLSDDTITGLLLTLLFAGQHTSAVLATWVGIQLLHNQEWLRLLIAEQSEVFKTEGMTLAALKKLVRLEHCIKETERLHPPLVMLMRKALQDFSFGSHVIPAGDLVLVSPAVSHRIADIFADPERYDPSRFTVPREEDRQTPYGLIGFGGGKHRCIGLAFAYQQVKVIWSVLMRRYSFELVGGDHRPNYATFVVGPHQPCLIRYCTAEPGGRRDALLAAE